MSREKNGYPPVFEDALEKLHVFSADEEEAIASYEEDIALQLQEKPKRLAHSLSVGQVAQALAACYGGSEEMQYKSRIAGILHDWEKAHELDELYEMAQSLDLENEPSLKGIALKDAKPLLHGFIAAKTLACKYPKLTDDVLRAIALHTLGASDAEFLDKVIYIADYIEPLRGSDARLLDIRAHVGKVSLEKLYFACYQASITYVIQTGRYLLPAAVTIYNKLVEMQ